LHRAASEGCSAQREADGALSGKGKVQTLLTGNCVPHLARHVGWLELARAIQPVASKPRWHQRLSLYRLSQPPTHLPPLHAVHLDLWCLTDLSRHWG
jgi:hypothetical protein